MARAKTLAQCVEKDLDEEMSKKEERTRPRKVPKRFDSSQTTATVFSVVASIRIQHFYPAIDKMLAELDKRFPKELKDFAHLQSKNFDKPEADSAIRRLCLKYRAFVSPNAVTEWRLFRHTEGLREMTAMSETDVCPVSGLTLDEAAAFLAGVRARRAADHR